MMPQTEVALSTLNTLAVPSTAEYLYRAHSVQQVLEALVWVGQRQCPLHVLGEGSNVVLAPRLSGLVLMPQIMGRSLGETFGEQVLVTFGAGENWHSVVQWALARGLYGLENLALIPGSVGAAPVQNIGAYGVELCQLFEQLQAVHLGTGAVEIFDATRCAFGYRDSAFKSTLRDQYLIVQVTLRLSLTPRPNLSYPALYHALGEGAESATPETVLQAVCALRQAKLPDPAVIPNCGSFFKNPIVPLEKWAQLREKHPDLIAFDAPPHPHLGPVKKLAAAWLIEYCGWKGKEQEGVAVHPRQALVLTNPHRRPGTQVLKVAAAIVQEVQHQFGVTLEQEPQSIGDWLSSGD